LLEKSNVILHPDKIKQFILDQIDKFAQQQNLQVEKTIIYIKIRDSLRLEVHDSHYVSQKKVLYRGQGRTGRRVFHVPYDFGNI
jgi:hypothetical protein